MPTRDTLLQGTLDLLILRVLALGPHHGHGIAIAIQTRSGDTLLVDHGSLYPALQRLEDRGWIRGTWGTSDNNRRARFYALTVAGRKQFSVETNKWNRLVESIARVMAPETP
jgi:PadR family transcriptional regulator, regulatory protein PadR